jgi:ATP/maltotriose-dependent transcriptional regulator MalT/DNA-binding SARP family transcriptional activator
MASGTVELRGVLRDLGERIRGTRLTLVSAPAGAGKTTLLQAWRERLRADATPHTWLPLAAHHSDAAELCADWLGSLAKAAPAAAEALRLALSQVSDPARHWRLLARRVLRALTDAPEPVVAFFDDFHELAVESSGALLVDELCRAPESRLRCVIATRGFAPPVAARLRAAGECLEVRAEDLALRADQVAALLAETGVGVDPELLTLLLAQTEGWALGVALAARLLAALPPEERSARVSQLPQQRDLFEYFAAEVLRREPPEVVAVLEHAALYGPARPAELAALAPSAEEGEAAVARAIERGLLRSDGEELTLQTLWVGLLRESVRRRLGDDEWRALLRRIGVGCARNLRIARAFDLLEEAREFEGCARLVALAGPEMLARGRRARLLEGIARVPREIREREPVLRSLEGLALIGRDGARAGALLESAAESFAARGEIESERQALVAAALAFASDGRTQDARRTVRRMFGLRRLLTDAGARGELLAALAGRALLDGRLARARRLSERAARAPIGAAIRRLNDVFRAVLSVFDGDLDRAQALVDTGLAEPELASQVLPYYAFQTVRAYALALRGDALRASEEAREVWAALADLGFDRSRLATVTALAQILRMAGDLEGARQVLEEGLRLASGVAEAEAGIHAELALVSLLSQDRARARREGELALRPHADRTLEGFSSPREPIAHWVLARTGSADEAWKRLRAGVGALERGELALTRHAALLYAADVARSAGDPGGASRLAGAAWQLASDRRLPVLDRLLPREVIEATAREAIARGEGADSAARALAALRPEALSGVLEDLVEKGPAPARLRAVAEIARLRDRRFHAVLAKAASAGDARLRRAAEAVRADLDPKPRYGLRFETLGGFRALRGDAEIADTEWRGVTTRRLLFRVLVAEGRPVPRERLLEDLWADATFEAGRSNLRVAMSRLHDALEPDRPPGVEPHFVITDGDSLRWNRSADLVWDALEWEARAKQVGTPVDPSRLAELRGLFDAYGGRMLPELAGDVWLDPLRLRLAERFAEIGHALAEAQVARGDSQAADGTAERLLAEDPLDERAAALRMRLRLQRGDRAAALRIYEGTAAELRRQLEAEPGAELEGLARQARAGRA